MKIKEIVLFRIIDPENIHEKLIKQWKSFRSEIVNGIRTIIEGDAFLREKIDELRIEWNNNDRLTYPLYGHIHRQGTKVFKDLIINFGLSLSPIMDYWQEVLFQLYKIPGEEKYETKLPIVQKQLKEWHLKLGDDFYVLYPAYNSQLRAAGIQLGIIKNHPEPRYKQRIYDLYSAVLQTGIPGKKPSFDLGDVTIERLEKGSPKRRSLLGLGSYRIIIGNWNDYLAHYVVGTPVSTMSTVFSYAGSHVATEMGKKLEERLKDMYKGTNPTIVERLFENTKLIGPDTFDECFHPSLMQDKNYLSIVEKYLSDCVEIKELMRQQQPQSSVRAYPDDTNYLYNVSRFLHATREHDYIR